MLDINAIDFVYFQSHAVFEHSSPRIYQLGLLALNKAFDGTFIKLLGISFGSIIIL